MAESPESPSRYSLPPEEKAPPKAKKTPTRKRKAPPQNTESKITEAGKIKIDF